VTENVKAAFTARNAVDAARRDEYRLRALELSDVLREVADLVSDPRTSSPEWMQKIDAAFAGLHGCGPARFTRMAVLDAIEEAVAAAEKRAERERTKGAPYIPIETPEAVRERIWNALPYEVPRFKERCRLEDVGAAVEIWRARGTPRRTSASRPTRPRKWEHLAKMLTEIGLDVSAVRLEQEWNAWRKTRDARAGSLAWYTWPESKKARKATAPP